MLSISVSQVSESLVGKVISGIKLCAVTFLCGSGDCEACTVVCVACVYAVRVRG